MFLIHQCYQDLKYIIVVSARSLRFVECATPTALASYKTHPRVSVFGLLFSLTRITPHQHNIWKSNTSCCRMGYQ